MLKTAKLRKAPNQNSTLNYDQEIALEKENQMHTAKRQNGAVPFSDQT